MRDGPSLSSLLEMLVALWEPRATLPTARQFPAGSTLGPSVPDGSPISYEAATHL